MAQIQEAAGRAHQGHTIQCKDVITAIARSAGTAMSVRREHTLIPQPEHQPANFAHLEHTLTKQVKV